MKIVLCDDLGAKVSEYRNCGRTIVFTNGCFDLLHQSHVLCLEQAATLGDVLIVAVNSDRSVRQLKGPGRPSVKERQRAEQVASLRCVDLVVVFDQATPCDLIQTVKPDVLVKGGDYGLHQIIGREIVESYGGTVTVTQWIPGTSTTEMLASRRISERIPAP